MLAIVLLSFTSSHNLLWSIGIPQPFEGQNERLRAQRDYTNIVFEDKTNAKQSNDNTMMKNAGISIFMAVVLVIMVLITPERPDSELLSTMAVVAIVLTLFIYLIGCSTRFSVMRVIPCPRLKAD